MKIDEAMAYRDARRDTGRRADTELLQLGHVTMASYNSAWL